MSEGYQKAYQESINNPEQFWDEAAGEIKWYKKYSKVLDDSDKPFYRWFPDGELNTCYNAIDYHVETGRGNQVAVIYNSPVTNTLKKFTYKELLEQVARFAGFLIASDVEFKVPSTVEDESTLAEIRASIKKMQSRTQL